MNVDDMKRSALNAALQDESKPGNYSVLSAERKWSLTCHCNDLVKFSFFLEWPDPSNEGEWRVCQSFTEEEAVAFLKGAGLQYRDRTGKLV